MHSNQVLKSECSSIIYASKTNYTYTSVLDEPLLQYFSGGISSTGGFCMLANYLATINNLSDPVYKTVDKTMKITYIIQE